MKRAMVWTPMAVINLFAVAGCTLEAGFDPANWFRNNPLDNALEDIGRVVADPLGSKPFPSLIGGDSERVFYATNLGDIRIEFPGATSDVVLPGLLGPSNVYKLQGGQRELLRALVPAGVLTGLATDGESVVFIYLPDQQNPGLQRLVAGGLGFADDRTIFEAAAGTEYIQADLAVADGRVAFIVSSTEEVQSALHVQELTGTSEPVIVTAASFDSFDLQAGRLAYVARDADGKGEIVLRDLASGTTTTLATGLDGWPIVPVFLTNNNVVWAEPAGSDVYRVVAHDIAAGTRQTWVDAIAGTLTGASDDYFITQQYVDRWPNHADQLVLRRYDADGRAKKTAELRADDLVGQSRLLGDRIVYVNASRRIVVVPLNGGERQSFAPF